MNKIKKCFTCGIDFNFTYDKARFCSKKCCEIEYRKNNKKSLSEDKKKWNLENKNKKQHKNKEWFSNNKDRALKQQKDWKNTNKEYVNNWYSQYDKKRRKEDINYKIAKNLRSRFSSAIKNNCKTGSAVEDLGCSIDDFKKHIESLWQEGMTWDNWSPNGWHIDHKLALANFDLTDKNELKKACHYTNLQPMWAKENISKGTKK